MTMPQTKSSTSDNAAILDQQASDMLLESMQRDRLALTIMMVAAALIGIWSLACLLAGLVNIGGVLELGTNWLSAVIGR